MTLPPQSNQPQDPNQQQPNGYGPSQYGNNEPPTFPQYSQPGWQQPPAQPGQNQPQPGDQPYYGQPGPFPQHGQQPQSFQDKLKFMTPKQFGKYAGIGGGGLLVLIVLLVFVTAGGSPSAVTDDFMAAIADADLDEAAEYTCDSERFKSLTDLATQEEVEKAVEGMDWEILDEDINKDEDKATVDVRIIGSEEIAEEKEKVTLEKRDGDWLVCNGGI